MLRAEIGERTIWERLVNDESEKLGGFGASNFDAAIDAAVTATKVTTPVTNAKVVALTTTVVPVAVA